MRRRRSTAQVWRVPALLAVVSLVGMVVALPGSPAGVLLSWVALALPVAVCLRAFLPGAGREEEG